MIRDAIGSDVRLARRRQHGLAQTAKQAIRIIRAMEAYDLELVEQPLLASRPCRDGGGAQTYRRPAHG